MDEVGLDREHLGLHLGISKWMTWVWAWTHEVGRDQVSGLAPRVQMVWVWIWVYKAGLDQESLA